MSCPCGKPARPGGALCWDCTHNTMSGLATKWQGQNLGDNASRAHHDLRKPSKNWKDDADYRYRSDAAPPSVRYPELYERTLKEIRAKARRSEQ